jgi:hypothetical protein
VFFDVLVCRLVCEDEKGMEEPEAEHKKLEKETYNRQNDGNRVASQSVLQCRKRILNKMR